MPRGKSQDTTTLELLEMALVGYRMKTQEIEGRIQAMRGRNSGARSKPAPSKSANGSEPGPAPRRTLSASARKRIAIAQKKRWAEHHKKMAAGAKAE